MKLRIIFVFIFWHFANGSSTEQNSDILLGDKTAIQLKIFDNAFRLPHQSDNSPIYYHVQVQDETKQWDTKSVLYSRLVPDEAKFESQPQNGVLYNRTEFVTFFHNTTNPNNTYFTVHLMHKQSHFRAFLEPIKSFETSGYRNATLLDDKLNAVGEIRVIFLVIRPIKLFDPKMSEYSYTDDVVFIGHRGTGVGRRFDLPKQYLENTIAAFNFACSKGAQMIELDVQLTSDKIPIIYHNFAVNTFIHDRKSMNHNVSFRIPIKDISYQQFKKISTDYIPHVRVNIDTEENQSFETLENVLKKMNPHCGINVEIKYPQLKENLHYDGEIGVELNEYVDRILQVLYSHAGTRKIVITSFHVDLCTMIQLKQNRFRVALLTSGDTRKWNPKGTLYYDPRSTSIELGSAFAQSMHLKGLSLLTDDVLFDANHIDYIRSRNLTLYLWGNKLNSYERLIKLKRAGVNALIFDHVDLLLANHTTI